MLRGSEGKIIGATMIRDLFGSILYLSMQQKIDITQVLKYPLTPVLLCLSQVNGAINSTPKSNLLNYIDSQFVTVPPSIDGTIIDAAFFLRLQINPPDTFRGIAGSILNHIMRYIENVFSFVADIWLTPSFRDAEHIDRDAALITYKIRGTPKKNQLTENWP